VTASVRAATLVAPHRLEVRDYPYPRQLAPGAVLLRMLASGICAGASSRLGSGRRDGLAPLPGRRRGPGDGRGARRDASAKVLITPA